MAGHVSKFVSFKGGDVMVATNNVPSVDRMVRVLTTTMAVAFHYRKDWEKHCVILLDEIARQLNPVLKDFGRPLGKELERVAGRKLKSTRVGTTLRAIVLMEPWAYLSDRTPCMICYTDRGWLLVALPSYSFLFGDSKMLTGIIGKHIDGALLFLERCNTAVEKLFEGRRRRLAEAERACLLHSMVEAFDPSKLAENLRHINSL